MIRAMRVLIRLAVVLLFSGFASVGAFPQETPGLLDQMSESLKALSRRVSPAVVEIRTSRYGSPDDDSGETSMVVKQQVVGSGVIVDSDGYIVTNAHVIEGAKHIRVYLNQSRPLPQPQNALTAYRVSFDAKVVGTDDGADLAVLKIEATQLPTILFADYQHLRQGQMVVAIGSPLGAHGALTMGVVSSVARQIESDDNNIYIQTDAALNPGNSGGPLVDTKGMIVGINTLIGDGDRIGLAIPSDIVKYTYEEIRKFGQIHQGDIGLDVQEITPIMTAGLRLTPDDAVIVADVRPGGPAEKAGIRPGDAITRVDGTAIETLVDFVRHVYRKKTGDTVALQIARGGSDFLTSIRVSERKPDKEPPAKNIDLERTFIAGLGVYTTEVAADPQRWASEVRQLSGVLVTGKSVSEQGTDGQSELQVGDVIHSLNGTAVEKITQLRSAVGKLKTGDPVVLQVERKRKMVFVSFEFEL